MRDAESAAERAAAQRATIEKHERALLAEMEGKEKALREEARRQKIEVRSPSHWSPYDPVRVVNADPLGFFPAHLSAHRPSLSTPAIDAFQLHLTPFNSPPTFARMERPRV